jgi:hypothetical protein
MMMALDNNFPEVAQYLLVGIHHGHFVGGFARQVVRCGAADLASTEYQDFHRTPAT